MTGRDSSYKQLPLGPDFACLTAVALMGPTSGRWRACFPRVLLCGATSAVIHYNCFARTIAVLINLTVGIPVLTYFDYCGALGPEPLGAASIRRVESFGDFSGTPAKIRYSKLGNAIAFLCPRAPYRAPSGYSTQD